MAARRACALAWVILTVALVSARQAGDDRAAVAYDARVAALVAQVSTDRLSSQIQTLENYQTRYFTTSGSRAAATAIADYFRQLGLAVQTDDFVVNKATTSNVIATIPGRTSPDQVVIVGAHYDSYADKVYLTKAPGADDNASGTAGVMEIARVLAGQPFDFTIRLIAFGAEENNFDGSRYYAQAARQRGEKILAMLNMDMIGFVDHAPEDIDVTANPASTWLADYYVAAARIYTGVPVLKIVDASSRYSDHVSFWDQGYAAVEIIEDDDVQNPYYHTANDHLTTLDMTFATSVVQTTLAVTAALAQPAASASSPPFGAFDTPVGGATGLQGSFAVTGWALDDTGVDRVELWRNLVAGEPASHAYTTDTSHPAYGKVFIANGLFVDGSRPDVESKYASYPNASRSGWGYLLLSWGLWGQGNGTYVLSAYAFDKDGRATLLGTKTIGVDNAHATKPFGAIDTPAYGGTVSGSVWNFGWALTPNATPACTIQNGKVTMNIDSGPFVTVNYGDTRTDVAAAFPGFSNGNNSGGAYYIDMTKLTNGVHQIGWLVYDTCNRGDGVGSRFFTVLNTGAGDAITPAETPGLKTRPPLMPEASRVDGGRGLSPGDQARSSVSVRQLGSEWQSVAPTADGWHVIEVGQDGRIEVQLPPAAGGYVGYQEVGGGLRALPLGASLDGAAGVFYWQPAPGFLGAYALRFVAADGTDVAVRVVVGPPMRLAVDTPADGAVKAGILTVAGWAVDLASESGSGVDTVHVWAYPLGGAAPIFLGAAACGDPRPDVAALYGAEAERSGYRLRAAPLSAGTYDVVVYARRVKTGSFDAAQIVRVTVR